MIKGTVGGDDESSLAARPPVRFSIDDVSKQIVGMLQVDGRRSMASIGEELRIGSDAVEQRVDSLVESGAISFTAVSDPLQLGFTQQAMLGISVERGLEEGVADRLAQLPEVAYLVLTAGGFEILAEVVATSEAHLEQIVDEGVRPTPGVRSVHVFHYDAVEKETYTWGVL